VGIEIRLLGRFAVLRDGAEVPAGDFRQSLVRRLVRILASRRGEFVSRDFLVDALWPAGGPADPGANLRVLVTLARKALGPPAQIQSSSGGYTLAGGEGCLVDTEEFLRQAHAAAGFLDQGRYEPALRAFRAALQVWRGEPLAEDAFEDWSREYRSRLMLVHLHMLEGAAQAALSMGAAVEAVGWAERAVSGEPLRERSNALLIEALADSGDTARALQAYDDFRRRLAEELGLDPSGEVQQVQARILRGEAPARVQSTELPLPNALGGYPKTFAGRTSEIRRARDLLTHASGRTGVIWVLGEPGIGKTRLAAEIAREVHAGGGVALFGRCSEDLNLPYQPFLEALEWYLDHAPNPQFGEQPQDLVRLVPRVGDWVGQPELAGAASPEVQQHRLHESVRGWLTAAAGGRPLVLVVDDVHWADRATLALVGHLGSSPEPSRAWLVCTVRDSAPDGVESAAVLAEQLDRRGTPGCRLGLSGLDVQAVGELVASAAGGVDRRLGSFVEDLHRETAGNPLYVDSILRDPASGSQPLGRSLPETISRRVGRLPPEVQTCLRAASIAGLEFDLRVVALAAGFDEMEVLRALETAARAALLEEMAANSYRFRHGVVRTALRMQLSESRRVRLHMRVGEALEVVHARKLDQFAHQLSTHFLQALPVGGAPKAYRYTVLAAQQAARLLSHEEEVAAYGRALQLLDDVDEGPPARYRLLVARSEAQRRSGDVLGALVSLNEAVAEAEANADIERMAEAAIAFEETSFWLGAPEDAAAEVMGAAHQAQGTEDSVLRAVVLASLGRALRNSGRPEAGKFAVEAGAMAERLGDPRTGYQVAFRAAESSITVSQAHEAAPAWTKLSRSARRFGETDAYLLALGQAMWAHAMLGDLAVADAFMSEYSEAASNLRQPKWECWVEVFRALRLVMNGRLAEAEQHLGRAQEIGKNFGWDRPGLYGMAMFLVRREQGRLKDLAPVVRTAAALNPTGAFWRPGLAALYVELDMVPEARAELDELGESPDGVPDDGSRELSLSLMAEVAAGLGDVTRAGPLIDGLLPCSGRLLVFLLSAVCLGPADRLLAMLASVAGRSEEAEAWFESALSLARRIESPLWVAHTLYDYSAHLQAHGGGGPADLLSEAARLCRQHGLTALGARVDRLVTVRS
jgi:DNA-binding SARP family transcriptional activator